MKRYNGHHHETEDGKWVKYHDHVEAMAARDKRIAELEGERDQLQKVAVESEPTRLALNAERNQRRHLERELTRLKAHHEEAAAKARECIGLLSSMVRGGEQHSPESEKAVNDALNSLSADSAEPYTCPECGGIAGTHNRSCTHTLPFVPCGDHTKPQGKPCLICTPAPEDGDKRGDDKRGGCACEWTTPCHPRCTCVDPLSSAGCTRCCSYGSEAQRRERAEYIAGKFDTDAAPSPEDGDKQAAPTIVCLCGSTRFYKEFQRANYELTMKGEIVLSVGFYMHSSQDAHGEAVGCTPEQKEELDQLHFRKIELADYVYVINVGGYIGESTRNEIHHAQSLGKRIEYLESPTVQEDGDKRGAESSELIERLNVAQKTTEKSTLRFGPTAPEVCECGHVGHTFGGCLHNDCDCTGYRKGDAGGEDAKPPEGCTTRNWPGCTVCVEELTDRVADHETRLTHTAIDLARYTQRLDDIDATLRADDRTLARHGEYIAALQEWRREQDESQQPPPKPDDETNPVSPPSATHTIPVKR